MFDFPGDACRCAFDAQKLVSAEIPSCPFGQSLYSLEYAGRIYLFSPKNKIYSLKCVMISSYLHTTIAGAARTQQLVAEVRETFKRTYGVSASDGDRSGGTWPQLR